MRKIYEFINITNEDKISTILDYIDRYTFYTDNKWMFVGNEDFFPEILIDVLSVSEFFEIGEKISYELNKDNISNMDCEDDIISIYFNKIFKGDRFIMVKFPTSTNEEEYCRLGGLYVGCICELTEIENKYSVLETDNMIYIGKEFFKHYFKKEYRTKNLEKLGI